MREMKETEEKKERAFLVGVQSEKTGKDEALSLLSELKSLAGTLGLEVSGEVLVKIRQRHSGLLLGTGKTDEIIALAKEANSDSIVFDNPLSPTQQRNWEELSELSVYDRHELILKIFSARASTKEASLQVELARLQYALPRLAHSYASLSRQRGGRYGTKGSGEQKIELDKREIKHRIGQIKEELKNVSKGRGTQRKRRDKVDLPCAAIVGYTNAGKSSLLNALTRAEVLAEDKLFATLDPTTRRLGQNSGKPFLLTDTVGFVRNLPHGLVEAFKSTLEEATRADLLILIVDGSDAEAEKQYATTMAVLEELGASEKPKILVYNKIDLVTDPLAFLGSRHEGALLISATTGKGLGELGAAIEKALSEGLKESTYEFPHSRYDLVALAHRSGTVLSEEHGEKGILVRARLPERTAGMLKEWEIGE
jgi:GTP-binding protein HflX